MGVVETPVHGLERPVLPDHWVGWESGCPYGHIVGVPPTRVTPDPSSPTGAPAAGEKIKKNDDDTSNDNFLDRLHSLLRILTVFQKSFNSFHCFLFLNSITAPRHDY